MKKLFLVVEDTFEIKGRGLIVVPGPLVEEYRGSGRLDVVLELPDHTERRANMSIQWIFQTPPPKERRWGCTFENLAKADVPIGTKVWYDEVTGDDAEPHAAPDVHASASLRSGRG